MSRQKVVQAACAHCKNPVPRKPNKFCSPDCHYAYTHAKSVAVWLAGEHSGNHGDEVANFVRKYLFDKFGSKCSKCSWAEINKHTGKIPLTVEHKDGNPSNTVESNLDLLCPNCHSWTETYGALNKGHGRKLRQLKRDKAVVAQPG